MEKRAFIAVVLSLLVLLVYQEWISRYYGTPVPAPTPPKQETEKTVSPAETAPAKEAPIAPVKAPSNQATKEVRVETNNYVAIFTTRGARLKSFAFKNYRSA